MKLHLNYQDIIQQISTIDPLKYAHSRNYTNGAVSFLSPYISRGIISTKLVAHHILQRGFTQQESEKFLQELAWRDYWQLVWKKENNINRDLKRQQVDVNNEEIPAAVDQAKTGVTSIDKAIEQLFKNGYMHNHVRMYVASICCNLGKSHWLEPAKWMYYHLLDADWGSNALSWQWVAGTNSSKKYFANQDNINKYTQSQQKDTFLDKSYEELMQAECPDILEVTHIPHQTTQLPKNLPIHVPRTKPTLIYNFYNLDPHWRKKEDVNRVLLLEPSHFEEYPICERSVQFMIDFAKQNISNIQIYTGEFTSFVKRYGLTNIIFKEHPFNHHFDGTTDSRDWMFNTTAYYPSFFKFWNEHKNHLTNLLSK